MEDDGMYGTSQMGETYTGLKVYLRLKIPVNKKYLDLDSFKAQVVEVSSWNSEMIVSPIWYRNVWKLSVEFDGKAKVKFYDGYKTVPTVGYIKGSAEMGRDQVLRRLLYLGR